MNGNPRIVHLSVGMPQTLVGADGREFRSSIGRRPATGPVRLTACGFEGDACEYQGHHGGNMKVNVFDTETYRLLEADLLVEFDRPNFGENLTLEGWPEETAAVGDTFRAGTALLQISQPREPCGNLVRFTGVANILRSMTRLAASGYYMRVIEPGVVQSGDCLEPIERVAPEWTIARLHRVMYEHVAYAGAVAEAESVGVLSENWKRSLRKQHERAVERLARKAAS